MTDTTARQVDLVAAARQRLARARHWRAIVRAGGAPGVSVNRAEWRAAQALQCVGTLAQAAQARRQEARA